MKPVISDIHSCITHMTLFHSFICGVTKANDFLVWDPSTYEELVNTRIGFSVTCLYAIDECVIAGREDGTVVFLLPSCSDPTSSLSSSLSSNPLLSDQPSSQLFPDSLAEPSAPDSHVGSTLSESSPTPKQPPSTATESHSPVVSAEPSSETPAASSMNETPSPPITTQPQPPSMNPTQLPPMNPIQPPPNATPIQPTSIIPPIQPPSNATPSPPPEQSLFHPSDMHIEKSGDSTLQVWDTERGRQVQGTLLGRRSLVYTRQLSSLKKSEAARSSSLTRECREYLKKLPSRSIEEQNLEEYLLSNRMITLALFNQDDIQKYDRISQLREQELANHAEEEISETLKHKFSMLTHTCVIDDAEHVLMTPSSTRKASESPKAKRRDSIGGRKRRMRASPPPFLWTRSQSKGRMTKPIPRESSAVVSPLLRTLFPPKDKKEVRGRVLSDEDLGLYDVTNYYSFDEIAVLREQSLKSKGKETDFQFARQRRPTDGYSRLYLTMRRQSLLKKLFQDSSLDNEEYNCIARMVSKLMHETKKEVDLTGSHNTPENVAKLREYLNSLNATFEEIDVLLGDDSD